MMKLKKKYFINIHSGLPHHWFLGLCVMLCGILACVIPFQLILTAAGAIIIIHDLIYHFRVGWKNLLVFNSIKKKENKDIDWTGYRL